MDESYKVAVLGPKNLILGFQAMGLAAYSAADENEAKDKLREILKDQKYAIIFITDNLVKGLDWEIEMVAKRSLPAIMILPSFTGKSALSLLKIKKAIERATGSSQMFIKI
ncbi:MAG: Vacuolar H+transporting two-sector ATPase F subunit [uncultured bacterium]|nr:MAG: Vacuolar H+transporting two-sector ATPase F subunit [uncultured bacterium]HLD61567.1 V-type ATP synthase subunit F [Patescibacteria group bacterium]